MNSVYCLGLRIPMRHPLDRFSRVLIAWRRGLKQATNSTNLPVFFVETARRSLPNCCSEGWTPNTWSYNLFFGLQPCLVSELLLFSADSLEVPGCDSVTSLRRPVCGPEMDCASSIEKSSFSIRHFRSCSFRIPMTAFQAVYSRNL